MASGCDYALTHTSPPVSLNPSTSFCLSRTFEPKLRQLINFSQEGVIVILSTEFFAGSCRAYYGELTFLEAFQRTGRTVTRSQVLTHPSPPNVLVLLHLSLPPGLSSPSCGSSSTLFKRGLS